MRTIAEVIASTNRARDVDFLEGLATEGYLEQFLAAEALDTVAGEVRSKLGSTTHLAVMDEDGGARPSRAPTAHARASWCPAPACT